ncbi:MAG TPA: hypothetical protein VFB08_19285 [Burkholderiales bacterium]|nr:hypothetical protein [Burkholderiales bacterium]
MAAPLIPYLRNVKRWVWLLYAGGFLAFMGIVWALDRLSPPGTPANQLVTWLNGWLFLLPAGMIAYGFYISARWWRCPRCGQYLPTKTAVWDRCRRCGEKLRE